MELDDMAATLIGLIVGPRAGVPQLQFITCWFKFKLRFNACKLNVAQPSQSHQP